MLKKETKTKVVADWASRAGDTGSSQVQIGLLTERIAQISKHLGENKKDQSSRHGLLKLVGTRRRLLRYLSNTDKASFKNVSERIK